MDNMISPSLIKIIYYVGAVLITIGSIVIMALGKGLYGLGALTIGNLLWRLFCEGWLLMFKIYETLISIDSKLKPQTSKNSKSKTKNEPDEEDSQPIISMISQSQTHSLEQSNDDQLFCYYCGASLNGKVKVCPECKKPLKFD